MSIARMKIIDAGRALGPLRFCLGNILLETGLARAKVLPELDRLMLEGIIKPVTISGAAGRSPQSKNSKDRGPCYRFTHDSTARLKMYAVWDRLWRAAVIIRPFTAGELATTTDVPLSSVRRFIQAYRKGGFLRVIGRGRARKLTFCGMPPSPVRPCAIRKEERI